jgi:RNA polymerase sigma-70 factor (ECF subfamily)
MEESTSVAVGVPDEERTLVAGLRAGDELAYERVVRRYTPRLLATARRILQSEEDARDAVQDAFLSAFKALPHFAEQARFSTWLHRIGVNAALMKLRSRQRQPERPISELLPKFHEDGHPTEPASPWEPAETLLEREEIRALVRRSIDELPETHRLVLILRDIEELDTEQTAAELGVNPGTVKTRLHRARQALRTLLDCRLRGGSAC